MVDKEVRKDIITMYEAVRNAYMNGEYNSNIDTILDKYEIKINEDGYVEEDDQ